MRSRALGTGLFLLVLAAPESAGAFAGFYASRGEGEPRSDASMVVLMRDGDRTVVTMQPDYRGPAEDLALVVPVPGAIRAADVRTLRSDALDRIERLGAPRLVEYWERDPCAAARPPEGGPPGGRNGMRPPPDTAEARFAADAYDVEIVEVDEPAALVRWLRAQGLRAPAGLAAAARPYVATGHRFLIARLDASRLSLEDGRAALPPLRFHYRSEELVLPVRIGRLGADGPQDLVIHVLARGHRYEVGNRDDVLAPTNLVMYPSARERFGEVYATIFERVLTRHPGAVVTEYAWDAQTCAPCPTPPLGPSDLDTFGRDVVGPPPSGSVIGDGFVLTRLHAQIDGAPDTDLVLRPAAPIAGGRNRPGRSSNLAHRIDRRATRNAFQARYAILHAWERPASCATPTRGRWGSPARQRRPPAIFAPRGREPIQLGRLRRYVHTWAPVLRIPSRGDAAPASEP